MRDPEAPHNGGDRAAGRRPGTPLGWLGQASGAQGSLVA